jgi:two-component system, LytTR family, response regulator
MKSLLKVFLVDDEPLALKRLSRLLSETAKVEIIGSTTEPLKALQIIPNITLDAIFLDIQMPELTGFELLQKFENYPPVIFTTAFDEFALKAFEVYSIDYLLKPIEAERLAKALEKLEKLVAEKSDETNLNLQKLLESLSPKPTLERLPSRIGGKVQILDVKEITHFYSEDKMTFAAHVEGKIFPVDFSLNELENRLEKRTFLRVHRNSIVNINFIEEVHGWFSGQVMIRLKTVKKVEIIVARDRVKVLKEFLGM